MLYLYQDRVASQLCRVLKMPKGKHLTPGERHQIIGAHSNSVPLREISANLHVLYQTVCRTVRLKDARGPDQRDLPRPGRPPISTPEQDRRLYNYLRTNPRLKMAELVASHPNGATQIKAKMKRIDPSFRKQQSKIKPTLSTANEAERLRACKAWRDMPVAGWQDAHWTDECSISIQSCKQVEWVWRKSGEAFKPGMTTSKPKSSVTLNIWASMQANGTITLRFSEDYYEDDERHLTALSYNRMTRDILPQIY